MSNPISQLRDDFANNIIDPVWGNAAATGSATVAETGGQAVLTLPSSTAGTHSAFYQTPGRYDLTGDSFYWNIAQMVATGVAARALMQLVDASGGQLYWEQISGTLTAHKVDNGANTVVYTVAWNATTFKYLRIRESGGTIFFDSSTNGTTWTNRATTTLITTPITALLVQMFVSCGNIASPGALKFDDVNLILPVLATNWRWTQVEWSLSNRFRPITIASEAGKQGYIAVASTIDSSGALVSPVYYSGPMGSTSGGYNALTLASSQAAAQAMAVNLPLNGRWDLPSIVEARFIRIYHRSTDGASHKLFEFYPRRIVQTDDIEAESIRAINIAAGSITADKIDVISLGAINSNIGQLTLTNPTGAAAWLYQGSGTGDAPTDGLKLYNNGGIGRLGAFDGGVETIFIDDNGISAAAPSGASTDTASYKFLNGTDVTGSFNAYNAVGGNFTFIETKSVPATHAFMTVKASVPTTKVATVTLLAQAPGTSASIVLTARDSAALSDVTISATTTNIANATTIGSVSGGLNVGSGVSSATAGNGNILADNLIRASGNTAPATGSGVEVGYVNTTTGGIILSYNRTGAAYTPLLIDGSDISIRPGGTPKIRTNTTGVGFFNTTPVAKPTVTGAKAGNAALTSLLTALASYGLLTDSST